MQLIDGTQFGHPDKWYLPEIYDNGVYSFEDSLYVSRLRSSSGFYPDFFHASSPPVSYFIPPIEYTISTHAIAGVERTYVEFSPALPAGDIPYGAIHFITTKDHLIKGSISAKDGMLFQYDILKDSDIFTDGTLHLTLKSGFDHVLSSSEISEINAEYYELRIVLHSLNPDSLNPEEEMDKLGEFLLPLENTVIGRGFNYPTYDIQVQLADFSFPPGNLALLEDILTTGSHSDLYITVESVISDLTADLRVFRGVFAQQIMDASLSFEIPNTDEGSTIPIPQDNIELDWISGTTYHLNSESLDYDFEFEITRIYSHVGDLAYTYNSADQTITLSDPTKSGVLLFADVEFHAFKWGTDFIASEPKVFTFKGDYFDKYVEYLEFQIDYDINGVPGYVLETSDLDIIDVDKGAELLDFYLYNYKDQIWEQVDFLAYEVSPETHTFSYVTDREFTTFENYFLYDSVEDEFQVEVIFAMDVSFEDAFKSTLGFKMDTVTSNIFFDVPSSQNYLNPSVNFEIDLTDYLENNNNYLEELQIDLDYSGYIGLSDIDLFSEYGLIQENFNFYIENKSREFEKFELVNNRILLTREELSDLIYHNDKNDKIYLSAMLVYDWEAIIEVNIKGLSSIILNSKLELHKYELKVSYLQYQTKRISAFETDCPFDLAIIDAPNYIEDASGNIDNFADDAEPDIGINGGFLRNVNTHQRLMLRQKLYYEITIIIEGRDVLYPILLDHSYSDSIFRFFKKKNNFIVKKVILTSYYDKVGEAIQFLIALCSIIGALGMILGFVMFIYGSRRHRPAIILMIVFSFILVGFCGLHTGIKYFRIR